MVYGASAVKGAYWVINKLHTQKGKSMCCEDNKDEGRQVIQKSASDLISISWDAYYDSILIRIGDDRSFRLSEKEAIDVAKTILDEISAAKKKVVDALCSH